MVRIKRLLDLLSSVVALLSMGPILVYLDRPLLLVALLAIPAGFWCDRREKYPLPTWLATLIALCGMAFYAVQITRAEVALPVVHVMVILLVVRLLTPKEGRDYLQIFVLALFILAGSSLIHLEIGFIVYLILLVFGVILGLVFLTVHVTDQKMIMTRSDLKKLIKVGLIIPAVSLVLMMFFFVILPRTQHPFWDFLNPSSKGVAGLAETVQPGSFAEISGVKVLSFRAEGPELAADDRYWRALVLNQPKDGRWVRSEPPREGSARIEEAAPVTFMIYPEPRNNRYLLTLDRPNFSSWQQRPIIARVFRTKRQKKDDDPAYQECSDPQLAIFLNGLINDKRGKKEGPQPEPEQRLNNNIIFRKLKIALNLQAEEILEIMALVQVQISKHELSAFFRRPGHKQGKDKNLQVISSLFGSQQSNHQQDHHDMNNRQGNLCPGDLYGVKGHTTQRLRDSAELAERSRWGY